MGDFWKTVLILMFLIPWWLIAYYNMKTGNTRYRPMRRRRK